MPGNQCPQKNRIPRPINQMALRQGRHGRANLGPYLNLLYLRISLSLPIINRTGHMGLYGNRACRVAHA